MTHELRVAAAITGLMAAASIGTACTNTELPAACSNPALATVTSASTIAACVTVSTNPVTQDEARALGFPVDDDLAKLAQPIDVPFHRGDFACGTAADTSGQLRITVVVNAIKHYVNRPNPNAGGAITCRDWLGYDAAIDLRTDDGTLSGSITDTWIAGADSSGAHAMHFSVGVPAATFSGSLGIRAERLRQPVGTVSISTTIRGPAVSGQVFTYVEYCDGQPLTWDQGDGLFWPPDNPNKTCSWLEAPAPRGPMMTLDEFNAL
jgi:hypothetical protein